jgi:hypothetical protein
MLSLQAAAELELRKRDRSQGGLLRSVRPTWEPQAGPQSTAFESDADVIGYGGAAGGGKTDLLLGFAGTKQYRSVIFRRVFPLLEGIEARSREIYNQDSQNRQKDRYNESLHRWELKDGRTVRFAAMQYEDDKRNFQGRPFDFYGFDEATEFTETQVRFVTGWNRTTRPGQKCRVVMTFNPPMDEAGEWVTRYFAPWLDDTHPSLARDGELRWFAMVDGEEVERPNKEPFEHEGEIITPKSRTFFHAKLSDNPILEATGYGSTIDAMPEPIRTLLKGKFGAYKIVDPFQVIPAAWVRAAQERWISSEEGLQITALGIDVARGGNNQTVLAPLRTDRFDELKKYPGAATPDGKTIAMLVGQTIGEKHKPVVGVDVVGVGAAAYDAMNDGERQVIGVNFGRGSDKLDKSLKFKFANLRAEAYWKFREALDPDYGATVALPPDKELMGDLCAPKWEIRNGRIYIESKEEIIKRLGRSPDCGDGVVIAWWASSVQNIDWEGVDSLGHVEDFRSPWE